MTFIIIIIFFLLIASAFFSGSETGLTAASRSRMHNLEKDNNKKASIVNRLRQKKELLIGSILLGNNLVNILASALATKLFLELFGDAGVAYATLVMTFMILVFSEILPKTYALNHADDVALRVAYPVKWITFILSPVTKSISLFVKLILKMTTKKISKDTIKYHQEELRGAIELHKAEGDKAKDIKEERDMLRSILDLDEVSLEQILIHRKSMQTINYNSPLKDIIQFCLKSSFTRIPVWESEPDNIIGILNVRHFLALLHQTKKTDRLDLKDIMSQPWFVPSSNTLFEQLSAFRLKREHIAMVIDEYGSLLGMVTLEDILEEIVGDIQDESDALPQGIKRQKDGSYLMDGTLTIRDLNREFEWDLPDNEASTIAGLILHEAKHLPKEGQSFIFYGFRFEIIKRQHNQITSIKVTPPIES